MDRPNVIVYATVKIPDLNFGYVLAGCFCLQFLVDFVIVTSSSSRIFSKQKMSDESSIERSVDGKGWVCCP